MTGGPFVGLKVSIKGEKGEVVKGLNEKSHNTKVDRPTRRQCDRVRTSFSL